MIEGQRIDKWLWHARFAKTRTAAQLLARSGGVRVNRVRSDSASRMVKIGDVLTIAQGNGVRVVKIAGFSERRGPAAAAQALYEEIAEPVRQSADAPPLPALEASPRPNKRDRRLRLQMKQTGAPS